MSSMFWRGSKEGLCSSISVYGCFFLCFAVVTKENGKKREQTVFVIGYMLNWFQRAICDMVSTLLNLKCFRLWQTKYLWHFFQSNFGRLIMLIVFWILKPCNEWNSRPSQNMYMSSSTYTTIFIHFLRSCVHYNWTRKTGLSHTSFS